MAIDDNLVNEESNFDGKGTEEGGLGLGVGFLRLYWFLGKVSGDPIGFWDMGRYGYLSSGGLMAVHTYGVDRPRTTKILSYKLTIQMEVKRILDSTLSKLRILLTRMQGSCWRCCCYLRY